MKPILVHIHIFYPEMWAELKTRLAHAAASYPMRLFVTLVQRHPELEADILAFSPDAEIMLAENRGYDLGPFLQVVNSVNLDDYSYCIKLHSKRDMPSDAYVGHIYLGGSRWRDRLLAFLLPQNFSKVFQAFEDDSRLGMVGHFSLIFDKEPTRGNFRTAVQELLHQVGLPMRRFQFIAGTMFMCRAALLSPLQRLILQFPPTERGVENEQSPAHVMERFLGCLITAQGYELRDCYSSYPLSRRFLYRALGRLRIFLYQNKITASKRRIIKICRIPVYIGSAEKITLLRRHDRTLTPVRSMGEERKKMTGMSSSPLSVSAPDRDAEPFAAAPAVLLVSHRLDYTGAPIALLGMVEPLQRMGLAVMVLSPEDGPLRQAFEQKDCRVLIDCRPQDIDPQCFRMMGVELCICNTVVMGVCFAAYSAVLPSLLWIHENMTPPPAVRQGKKRFSKEASWWGWESSQGVMNPGLLRLLLPLQKRVAFCSELSRGPFRQQLPDAFLMPYIIRDQAAADEAALPSPRGGEGVHFAFIGTYSKRKSPHLILEALALMPPALRRRCRISLVGRSAVPDDYARQIETMAASFAEVQLLPIMEPQDVQRFFKTVDVLLCPSQSDPMPLVVTEAWMHGCSVVISDNVGQRCMAEAGDARNAYVVPVGDAAALSDVMQHLAEHPEALAQLSRNARRTYNRHFNGEITAQRWAAVVSSLREQAAKRPSLPAVSAAEVQAAMPAAPLLVHLHGRLKCRYLPYYLASLAPYPYELVVTLSADCAEERAQIASFCPQAVFVKLPDGDKVCTNPLSHVLRQVEPSCYSLYISLNAETRADAERTLALMHPRYLTDTLAAFRTHPSPVLQGHRADVCLNEPDGMPTEQTAAADRKNIEKALRKSVDAARHVFICRNSLLTTVAKCPIPGMHKPALVNICRLLPSCVARFLYQDKITAGRSPASCGQGGVARFLYQDKITAKGRRIIKICKIPVYIGSLK